MKCRNTGDRNAAMHKFAWYLIFSYSSMKQNGLRELTHISITALWFLQLLFTSCYLHILKQDKLRNWFSSLPDDCVNCSTLNNFETSVWIKLELENYTQCVTCVVCQQSIGIMWQKRVFLTHCCFRWILCNKHYFSSTK